MEITDRLLDHLIGASWTAPSEISRAQTADLNHYGRLNRRGKQTAFRQPGHTCLIYDGCDSELRYPDDHHAPAVLGSRTEEGVYRYRTILVRAPSLDGRFRNRRRRADSNLVERAPMAKG